MSAPILVALSQSEDPDEVQRAFFRSYAVARLCSSFARVSLSGVQDVPTAISRTAEGFLYEKTSNRIGVITACLPDLGNETGSLANVVVRLYEYCKEVQAQAIRIVSADEQRLDALRSTDLGMLISTAGQAGGSNPDSIEPIPLPQLSVVYFPLSVGDVENSVPAEQHGVDLLTAKRLIRKGTEDDALAVLYELVNLIPFAETNQYPLIGQTAPLTATDVACTLRQFGLNYADDESFVVIDRLMLSREAARGKQRFVARAPEWADVVHGADRTVGFFEREATEALLEEINRLKEQSTTRAAAGQLPCLFVTGAPGSGKTTLVRRAAAILVQSGQITVVDLGTNQSAVTPEDASQLVRHIKAIAQLSRPVWVVMDDPFFANSGWGEFLITLARNIRNGVAVVGATPTYLFDTFGVTRVGRNKVNRFSLSAPTALDLERLATVYEIPIERVRHRREDELIVVAMEIAFGVPFDEIIDRLWITLNNGIPIRGARLEDLTWVLRAFLVTCFLHRYYVICPESLMRSSLTHMSKDSISDDYLEQLADLRLRDGWEIFRVNPALEGRSGSGGISTLHARVASAAWDRRPAKGYDVADLVARASIVNASDVASELAQFILSARSSNDPKDWAFSSKLASTWAQAAVSTGALGRLVRGLAGVRPVAATFRPYLRDRIRLKNNESWVAAAELAELARFNSPEKRHLQEVDLPMLLRRGNMEASSETALRLARRNEYRPIIRDRLLAALSGELEDSRLSDDLFEWLIRSFPEDMIARLEEICEWLDAHPDATRVSLAFINWMSSSVSAPIVMDYLEFIIVDTVGRMLGDPARESVFLLPLIRALDLICSSDHDAEPRVIEALMACVGSERAAGPTWRLVLMICRDVSFSNINSQTAQDLIDRAAAWLMRFPMERPTLDVFLNLLYELRPVGEKHVTSMLNLAMDQLDTDGKADTLALTMLKFWRIEADTAGGEVFAMRGRLLSYIQSHWDQFIGEFSKQLAKLVIDEADAEMAEELISSVSREANDRQQWADLLKLVDLLTARGADLRGATIRGVEVSFFRWIEGHPREIELCCEFLRIAIRGLPATEPSVSALVWSISEWLDEHQEDRVIRLWLLRLLRRIVSMPALNWTDLISQAVFWLDRNPNDTEIRNALNSLSGVA
jgi:hypothetical protein